MQISVDNLRRSYDLIVVGSGPAGLTLARRFDDLTAASRTLIVESGTRKNAPQPPSMRRGHAMKLRRVSAGGDLDSRYYALHSKRFFGGMSNAWRGWCAVLERRAFVNGEWPIAYDELRAYYPQAADVLGLPPGIWERPEVPLPGCANLVYRPYYVAKNRRFDDLFSDLVEGRNRVDVLLDHTVTNVNMTDGVASGVSIRKSSPESNAPVEVLGSKTVLACGGIQNARLLQLSLPRDHPLPIGSYLSQHPHVLGCCHILLDAEVLDQIEALPASGWGIRHAIALSSDFSLSNRLLSATFGFNRQMGRRSSSILGRKRTVLEAQIVVRAEMRALEGNRVALSSSRKDFLGQPIAEVDFTFDGVTEEIRAIYDRISGELVRSGLGRLGLYRPEGTLHGGGHLIGSTRMGSDPSVSVTDANASVHGVRNLYVAGSSLFPAAGAAHPTFTILALSLRLADHLAGRST